MLLWNGEFFQARDFFFPNNQDFFSYYPKIVTFNLNVFFFVGKYQYFAEFWFKSHKIENSEQENFCHTVSHFAKILTFITKFGTSVLQSQLSPHKIPNVTKFWLYHFCNIFIYSFKSRKNCKSFYNLNFLSKSKQQKGH